MSKPWIIHQYAPSPNCERLRRVLVRLDLPFELQDYLPFSPEEREKISALVERSGHNQMPVLEVDGKYYGDSLAITRWLLENYPDRATRLMPADKVQAAAVHAYMLAGDGNYLRPEVSYLTADFRAHKGDDHAQKILAIAHQRRDWALGAWDAVLADRAFLVGEDYSLADIGVVSYVNSRIAIPQMAKALAEQGIKSPFSLEMWPEWDLDGATYPNLRTWLDRCNATEFTESGVHAA